MMMMMLILLVSQNNSNRRSCMQSKQVVEAAVSYKTHLRKVKNQNLFNHLHQEVKTAL